MSASMISDRIKNLMSYIEQIQVANLEQAHAQEEEVKQQNEWNRMMRNRVASNIPKRMPKLKLKKPGQNANLDNHLSGKSSKLDKKATAKGMVTFGHPNWNIVLNMMLGIRSSIKSVFQDSTSELVNSDFKTSSIFELVPRRGVHASKDTIKICKFYDYAPMAFNRIRSKFGIEQDQYLKSIGPEHMIVNLLMGNIFSLSELISSGKSGSFFYYSADGKYMLKTISKNEFHFLKSILKNYYQHMMDNPDTLMCRVFGMHKMKFNRKRRPLRIYFVVMNNIFETTCEIHERFDLKGSTYGRAPNHEGRPICRPDHRVERFGFFEQERKNIPLTSSA